MAGNNTKGQRFIVVTNKTGNDHLLTDLFKHESKLLSNDDAQRVESKQEVALSNPVHYTKNGNQKHKNKNWKAGLLESGVTKKRKKRHIFSCNNCRKLKTKCTVDPLTNSCYRCERLHLQCNLARINSESSDEAPKSNGIHLDKQLYQMRKNYERLNAKMDKLIETLSDGGKIRKAFDSETFDGSSPSELDTRIILPRYDDISPLNVMNQIHTSLLRTSSTWSDALKQSISNFLNFYLENESLCLLLSKTFLETAHYWIIPGGIGEIDREYVFHHPVNACVYVMLAMAFNMNNKYSVEEKLLYPIARSIITNILVSVPLSDHDIEALLYVALYGITRRGKKMRTIFASSVKNDKERTLMEGIMLDNFDGWTISSSCFNHCIISLDLKSIYERASDGCFTDDDIFHLRIFNASCCSHYQFAIGYGRPAVINTSYTGLHKLILQYPNATIGDAIKVAELELYWTLCIDRDKIINGWPISVNQQTNKDDGENAELFLFSDLDEWYENWSKIMSKDVTHGLQLSYYFTHVVLALQFMRYHQRRNGSLDNKPGDNDINISFAREQACQYSFSIIKLFLSLPRDSIKGSPLFLFCEIVYACVSLFDFRSSMDNTKQKASLSAISKVYWHLNKAGEEINVATESIAGLIRKLVELANNHETLKYEQAASFVGSGSITETYIRKRHIKRRDSQQQRHLSMEDLPALVRRELQKSLLNVENRGEDHKSKHREADQSPNTKSTPERVTYSSKSSINGDERPLDPMLTEGNPSSNDVKAQTGEDIIIPDVTNFRSFEEFFYDIFNQHTSDI